MSKVNLAEFITDLKNFTEARRTKIVSEYTVNGLDPVGKYKIVQEEYSTFLNKLQRAVYYSKLKRGNTAIIALTERSKLYAPLRVDFDMRQKVGERIYKASQIKKLVCFIFSVIEKLKSESANFTPACVVLEKPAPRLDEKGSSNDKKLYKDGFHLHFNFIVDDWTFKHINKAITVWCCEQGPTGPFEDEEGNFLEVTNDEGIHTSDWLLYGSAKNVGVPFYEATRYYVSDEGGATRVGIEEIFDYFHYKIVGKQEYEYYLPSMLSINGFSSETELNAATIKEREGSRTVHKKTRVVTEKTQAKIMEDLKEIQDGKFLENLSQERADDFRKWLDVGYTLYGISDGDPMGLEMWIEFSRRSEKFEDGKCEKLWDGMKSNRRSMGSIIFMLSEDNPEYLKKYRQEKTDYLFRQSVRSAPNHRNVAVIVYKLKKDFFIYTAEGGWYTYGDHRIISENGARAHYWKPMASEVDLRLFLQEDMMEYYVEYLKTKKEEIRQKKLEEGQDIVEKEINKMPLIQNILNMIQQLGMVPFINNVVKACQAYFLNPNFEKIKDMNKELLACENGVLDLKNCIFRNGRPDDYITMSTGIYFNEEINPLEEKALDAILDKIYTDPRHKEYMLKLCAAMLYGKNLLKMIPCHIGPTNAGKSVLMTLLREAFGEYAKDLKKEKIIAGSVKSSGGPDIELYRLRGARVVIVPELEKKDSLDIGFLKTLSAALDRIYARTHHDKKGLDMEITFTVLFQLNDFPRAPGEDDALWGRILCFRYFSEFVKPTDLKEKPVPKTIEEQFKARRFIADMRLDSKLKSLAGVFLAKLFKVWTQSVSKFDKNPSIMDPPAEFIEATKRQRDQFDTVSTYIRENIKLEQIPDKITKKYKNETFCALKSLFGEYNDWFKQVYTNYRQSTNMFDFAGLLEKKLKRPLVRVGKENGFIGIRRLKELPDDPESSEEENDS